MTEITTNVDIGFAEVCEHWKVESRIFPSKIGGKPAWLDLDNVPNAEDLRCNICKRVLIFLCQIYAPYEEDGDNFHRTIYIFVCKNETCCIPNQGDNFKVFRSSLKRVNKFYSSDPPDEVEDANFTLTAWVGLCNLCGCSASKHCGKCKKVLYCCPEHQITDWKERHKYECEKKDGSNNVTRILFPEYQLVTESEELCESQVDEKAEMEKFNEMAMEGKTGVLSDVPTPDLESHVLGSEDKVFRDFRKRVSHNKDQVLRYERGGKPLWMAETPLPSLISNCEYCGGERQFEFQIMPQMLAVIKELTLDWGVLCVYTCKKSCNVGPNYKCEYVFKQDVTK